ncbi:hypothetical protein [Azospirillum soli]|uniref:hypothetical protein n=1 Tax=Azospirillum soli TaxID=1304799 RepID=UPI001AE32AD6|nr:hypothetical protein [Azospirillum soli]MBP2315249.1 uncharacterized protein [Azospirillum soli]
MFGKILLLALVIGAVWFGWRWYNRVGAVGRERLREREREQKRQTGGTAQSSRVSAEDMEKCPECGAYVAPHSAVSCGRPGCPYGR